MKRKLSTKKYILAFVLTLLVFAGGIILGFAIENARLQDSEQITLQEKVNLRSLQMQQSYIESGIADCKALNSVLENNIQELAKKISIIIDYEKRSVFNEKEFNLQLRDYFLTEIQYLLVSNEIDKKCEKDNVKIIYFYNEGAEDTQGDILDYIKKRFGSKVMVFSFNSAFKEEPMIDILLTSFDIKQYPSVVVEDKVLQGHTNVRELMKVVCGEFEKDPPKECNLLNN
jgi:hypothetical protein